MRSQSVQRVTNPSDQQSVRGRIDVANESMQRCVIICCPFRHSPCQSLDRTQQVRPGHPSPIEDFHQYRGSHVRKATGLLHGDFTILLMLQFLTRIYRYNRTNCRSVKWQFRVTIVRLPVCRRPSRALPPSLPIVRPSVLRTSYARTRIHSHPKTSSNAPDETSIVPLHRRIHHGRWGGAIWHW